MAFDRPTLAELVARVDQDILSRLDGTTETAAERVTRVLANGESGVAHGLHGHLEWLEKQLFPQTCDDDILVLHAVGVSRRLSATATGHVTFTGSDGVDVVAGTRLQVDGVTYETTAEVTITSGSALAPVTAVESGSQGNRPAGATLTMISPVPGVMSSATVDSSGITGGVDIETYDEWRERIMQRRARVPRGGAKGDWEGWALQVPGVTRAWEDPLGMGPSSVVIRIMADDAPSGPMPSQELLDRVLSYINERANVQAQVYVVAPDTSLFQPTLRVTPDTQDVRDAAAASLKAYIAYTSTPGVTLPISHIRGAISRAAGVDDYDLQSPTADVTYGDTMLPIWGGVTWV